MSRTVTALALLLVCPAALAAGEAPSRPRAFVGARLLPVSGPAVDDGVLVVEGSRIVAAGPRASVRIPSGAEVVAAQGKTIIPGLVDTHSHIGGAAGADGSGPIQPEVRVLDALNPRDPGFRRVVAGGITTLNVMPGSGFLCSGQTAYLKPRRGALTVEDLLIRDAGGRPQGGLKMANGTNSQRAAPFPGTRAKSAALVREAFVKAEEYRAKQKLPPKEGEPRVRDLGLETLVEVLDGTRVVHHHTHRADDIATVLRLSREFGFKVVLQHGTEAPLLAAEIAQAGVPVSMTLLDAPGGKLETARLSWEGPGRLERAGVRVAINSDDWITDSRALLRSAALAVRGGMSRDGALRAVTLDAARVLDLDARLGSLEAGKDADFVVLDGEPFALRTRVLETWIEGRKVFDRGDPDDRLFATGGYGAGQPTPPYLCCTGGAE
jgi:imidazolonepropionase-like amidohydrolase